MPEIVKENSVNNPDIKGVHSRSFFPKLGYKLEHTPLFGEYTPSAVMEVVPDDKKVRFQLKHNARSYTLKAPLMSDLQMMKDAFIVYNKCILPLNWHLIIKPPKLGDDVPEDANSLFNITKAVKAINTFSETVYNSMPEEVLKADVISYLNTFLRQLVCYEYFFSNGSLFANLGCQLSKYFVMTDYEKEVPVRTSFDSFFDTCINWFVTNFEWVRFHIGDSYYKVCSRVSPGSSYMSWRWLIEQIRDNSDWSIVDYYSGDDPDELYSSILTFNVLDVDNYDGDYTLHLFFEPDFDERELVINIERELSYQIVCAHFYTNDSVDYIYSADLYRQYVNSIYQHDSQVTFFSWDGINLQYDVFSLHQFNQFLTDEGNFSVLHQFLCALFAFKRSLRYKDYFVGSRTRPLAVGDTNAPVVSSQVNIIDIAQATAATRLANAVNRLKSGIKDYLRGIFNANPKPDYHDPQWLCSLTDKVFTPENENTGAAQFSNTGGLNTSQNSVTALFRSSGDNYAFELDVDEHAVIIAITSFDIERCYKDIIDRHYFHYDRYDMFNPMLQFVGDVPIYRDEFTVGEGSLSSNPLGYNLKDIEYKERANIAVGAFVENLPGYAFLDDEMTRGLLPNEVHVSPDFIRSRPCELDKFYLSLSGWSRGSYFHFIIKNTNEISASRPMVYAPSLM